MADSIIAIDFELTSLDPERRHVVEWGLVVDWLPVVGLDRKQVYAEGLVKPPIPIPPETSAVHHIIDWDVRDAETWPVAVHRLLQYIETVDGSLPILAAHNAATERAVMDPVFERLGYTDVRWVDTMKAAMRVWPDCPSFSNECIRYYRGRGTGRGYPQATHSALHDAQVTMGHVLDLMHYASLEDMITWTGEPAMLPRCPIGDWRGSPWADIEWSFLAWILRKADTMREDVVFCARREIERRQAESTVTPIGNGDEEAPF